MSSSHQFLRNVRRDLVAGIFILGPIALTIYLLYKLLQLFDSFLATTINVILRKWVGLAVLGHEPIPGLGLIALFLLLVGTGFAARNVFGRWVIRGGQNIMQSIPLVNRVYKTFHQISETVLSDRKDIFKRAVIIPYPSKGLYTLGILTSESSGVLQKNIGEDVVCVFVINTPVPTAGFLVYVPRKDVIEVDLSVEDALKLIVSGGIVTAAGAKQTPQT